MTSSEKLVITDYLRRYGWCYLLGIVLHFFIAIGITHGGEIPLIGMVAASGFVLGIELMRKGGSTVRTILALPITAPELARAWRFVALTLPAVLFFIVLLIGVLVGLATGGRELHYPEFVLLALLQTGMLGLFFFALTGLQTNPSPGAPLPEKCTNLFFGLLWGLSIPAIIFTQSMSGKGVLGSTPLHLFVWIFLAAATVAGFFRAETLVRNRTSTKKLSPRKNRNSLRKNDQSWRGFGGFSFYAATFGPLTTALFLMMLFFTWFVMNTLMGVKDSSSGDTAIGLQVNMFLAMIGLITTFQMLPMLRSIRILPRKRSTLATTMTLWPLILITTMGIIAYGLHAILTHTHFDWPALTLSIAGATSVLLTLPIFLRFGMQFITVFGMIFIVSFSSSSGPILSSFWKINPNQQLGTIAAVIALVLIIVWITTYRALGSEHPYRANRFNMGATKSTT